MATSVIASYVASYKMHYQGRRKALKSGDHRGLTGLICMAKIQFLWISYKKWGPLYLLLLRP